MYNREHPTCGSDHSRTAVGPSPSSALLLCNVKPSSDERNLTRHSATDARAPLNRPGHGTFFCANWYADFPDSDNFFYVFFHSDSASVRGVYFNSPDLDRQIIDARRATDNERRREIYRALDEMVVREAPMATLFHERLFVVHKPEVRGLRTSLVPPPVRYNDLWVES